MVDLDERTLKMKEGYIALFNEGYSPKQIAEEFGLSTWTVYHYLDEIAEEAGVPRETLLKRSRKAKECQDPVLKLPISPDLAEFQKLHQEAMKRITEVHNAMIKDVSSQEKEIESLRKGETTW